MKRILVLNPNSSTSVTAAMDAALAPLKRADGPEIVCATLAEGPPGIETQAHVESVVIPTARYFREHAADIYVIGCFSDPGLHLAREAVDKPVIGIAESAFLLALGLGQRFGIVAIKEGSIGRHIRAVRQIGLEERLAGDRAINVGVTEMGDGHALGRIAEVGRRLRDEDGANVLILGCSSMGIYRSEIEARIGLPVVDPTQAAVSRAIGMLALGYRNVA